MNATQSADRRTAILDAALACFLEQGFAATSIADIRARSGASTGSIYHFFENKGALALALVQRAISGWSVASARALDPAATVEESIKASVAGLVTWGLSHPAELRFLDEIRTLSLSDPTFASVAGLFAQGRTLGEARYADYVAARAVRDLPWPIAHALMLGAAYDFLRLADPATAPADAPAILADAAWAAVRA